MKRSSQRFQLANSVEFDGRNLVKQISLYVIQVTSVAVMLGVQFSECVLVSETYSSHSLCPMASLPKIVLFSATLLPMLGQSLRCKMVEFNFHTRSFLSRLRCVCMTGLASRQGRHPCEMSLVQGNCPVRLNAAVTDNNMSGYA